MTNSIPENCRCPFCGKSWSETGDDCMTPECIDRRLPPRKKTKLVARQLDSPVCNCCGYPWPENGVPVGTPGLTVYGICICGAMGAQSTTVWYDVVEED